MYAIVIKSWVGLKNSQSSEKNFAGSRGHPKCLYKHSHPLNAHDSINLGGSAGYYV